MEVTVVRLRRAGVKLSPAQVEAETRHHGFMAITYWHLKNGREGVGDDVEDGLRDGREDADHAGFRLGKPGL